MGIPYSREINAAFEQVTPLVAAGFQVLRTTKNISILLAIIQVLTVGFLAAILGVLLLLLVICNPDMEHERQTLITPWLQYFAHITLWGLLKSAASTLLVLGVVAWLAWRLLLLKQWVGDVEYEANVDANKALEDVDVDDKGKKGKKGGKGKGKGKAKETEGEDEETK